MKGERVSHYNIADKIGGGGMGVVYRAEDTKLRTTVALKFLPPELTRDENAKKRFLHEAQAASALDHPNICAIYGIDETSDGRMFIAMRYYEGNSLRDRIEHGQLAVREVFEIGYSVVDGLCAAHEKGIIHRDIKPGNIIITTDGFVKIVDFGLAKLAGRSKLTQSGMTPGTVAYMSPEQATGRPVDGRTDVWSFGVMMYEALTGATPFEGDLEQAMIYQILHDEPGPIKELRKDVPDGFASIINKCLAKNPDERYQTANELLDALVTLAGNERWLSSGTVRTVMRVELGGKSKRRGALIGIAAIGLLLMVATVVVWQLIGTRGEPALFTTEVRLAVMPIENLVADGPGDMYINGLSEWLVGTLELVSGLHKSMWVVPFYRTAPGELTTIRDARGAFGVNQVMSPSLQRFGSGYRLSLDLLDSESLQSIGETHVDFEVVTTVSPGDIVDASKRLFDINATEEQRSMLLAGMSTNGAACAEFFEGLGSFQKRGDRSQLDESIRRFENALSIDSTFAAAHVALGNAYIARCKRDADDQWCQMADDAGRKATALAANSVYVNVVAARIARTMDASEEAIARYEKAIETDPRNTTARRRLGDTLKRLDRLQEAENMYRSMVQTKPDYWEGYMNLGHFLQKTGAIEDALAQYRIALSLAPNDWFTLNSVGTVYEKRGEWTKAREHYLRSFALRPDCFTCRNVAHVFYYDGLFAEAAQYYKLAIEYCDSTDTGYYQRFVELGSALLWDGRRDEGLRTVRHALELGNGELADSPNDTELLAMIGWCYAMLGQSSEAEGLLLRTTAQAIDDAFVHVVVGQTFEKLGNREQALHYVSNAVRERYPITQIEAEPLFAQLTQDIRFRQLVEATQQEKRPEE